MTLIEKLRQRTQDIRKCVRGCSDYPNLAELLNERAQLDEDAADDLEKLEGWLERDAKEIRRLQAIVSQLDTTEDGVPVVPGMTVYQAYRVTVPGDPRLFEHEIVTGMETGDDYDPCEFYGRWFSTAPLALEDYYKNLK